MFDACTSGCRTPQQKRVLAFDAARNILVAPAPELILQSMRRLPHTRSSVLHSELMEENNFLGVISFEILL